MHNLAHNVPVLNSPSSFVYNQFGTYGTTYNQVCQVCVTLLYILKIIKCVLFDILPIYTNSTLYWFLTTQSV